MINTNTNFDREDHEQIAESTRQTWSSLEYALGLNRLPKVEGLQNANEATDALVARSITNLLSRTRSSVGADLLTQLEAQLGAERQGSTPGSPVGVPRSLEQDALTTAEAYIRVINRVIERRDIENLISQLPASIRSTDGSTNWQRSMLIGGNAYDTTIDLQNPAWRSGSEEEIRQRLVGRTLAQAGITAEQITGAPPGAPALPSHHVLTPVDINNLFASKREVVDPNLPIQQVSFEGPLPLPPTPPLLPVNRRVIFDVPGMLRDHPEWASLDRAGLIGAAGIEGYIRIIIVQTGAEDPILTPAITTLSVEQAFQQNSRSPTSAFGAIEHSLTDAVAARQPIDNLLKGAADNRELLLAFGAMQRDPTTIAAIQNNKLQGLLATRTRLMNEQNLRSAVDALRTLQRPTRLIGNAGTAGTIQDDIATLAPAGAGTAATTAYNRRMEKLEQELENSTKTIAAVTEILGVINSVASLQGPLTTGAAPLAPYAAALAGGTLEDEIMTGALDVGQMASVIETTFNGITAPDKGQILEATDYYSHELTQNSEDVRDAQKEGQQNGSEAAWAIVRRELENKGMRHDQLEKTLQYMRNQLDETPESARDVQELTNSVFPYEGDSEAGGWFGRGEATKEWQGDKSYRSLKTLGLHKVKPNLERYKNRLFNQACIGMTFAQAESAMSRSVPLPRLIDAYFRTKYLMDLPDSDPRRLPSDSAEMVGFMRKVHTAILQRAQLSLQNSASEESEAGLEQMGIKPGMKKIERLQAAQSFLINGESDYLSNRKATIEKLIDRAYRPIGKKIAGHERWKGRLKTTGKVLVTDRAKNVFLGNGSDANPLTWGAKGVKGVFAFLNSEV